MDRVSAKLRYGGFLELAGRSRAAGRAYALACGGAQMRADSRRADAATRRIQAWTGLEPRPARDAYRDSLISEAQEEADSAYFSRHPEAFGAWLPGPEAVARTAGPLIYATLHLGHPVLSCVYLRRHGRSDVRPIIRGLDAANPMTDPKRRWGERKVAWVRGLMGGEIFGVDAVSSARVREYLLAGGAVFAAFDVPGDVSDRSSSVDLFGERLRFSSGILSLAKMTAATILPVVALSGREKMSVHFGNPISGASPDAVEATFAEFARFIQRFPDQWWLWPYMRAE